MCEHVEKSDSIRSLLASVTWPSHVGEDQHQTSKSPTPEFPVYLYPVQMNLSNNNNKNNYYYIP